MRSRSKKQSPSEQGFTFMLLHGPGGGARRFRITRRHIFGALSLWLLAMLLFFYLGFRTGGAADAHNPESAAPANVSSAR